MSKEQTMLNVKVLERAERLDMAWDDRISMLMDLEYSGINVEQLLTFDDDNFAHDIGCIVKYFDRDLKEFSSCFVPRAGLL